MKKITLFLLLVCFCGVARANYGESDSMPVEEEIRCEYSFSGSMACDAQTITHSWTLDLHKDFNIPREDCLRVAREIAYYISPRVGTVPEIPEELEYYFNKMCEIYKQSQGGSF